MTLVATRPQVRVLPGGRLDDRAAGARRRLDRSPVDELAYSPRRSEEQMEVLGDSSIAVTGDDHGHVRSGVAREAVAIPAAT